VKIYGKKGAIFGKKGAIFGKKEVIFGQKEVIFGKKVVIFGKRSGIAGEVLYFSSLEQISCLTQQEDRLYCCTQKSLYSDQTGYL